jgi:prolyl-tRNA editing enzyme YbaK/EbsC (Cys-tRNA(Pro) deacylase)
MTQPISTDLSDSAQRVQQALNKIQSGAKVIELSVQAKTSVQAAEALGVSVGQIAKSLIFTMNKAEGPAPVLVVASGDKRVNENKLMTHLQCEIVRANPDDVRRWTGYAIGGIPPVGHAQPILTCLDRHLLRFDAVWAAAGNPKAVFEIKPNHLFELLERQGAQVVDCCE